MKKSLITIIIIFILAIPCYAQPYMKANINLGYALDTSVFSNPLPLFEKGNTLWLSWKHDHPLLMRHSLSTNVSFNIFLNQTDRVGITTSLNLKFPMKATSYTPTPNEGQTFIGEWDYIINNCLDTQKTSVFWGIGPVFKASFNYLDIGIALRLSIGGFDYIQDEVILGLQAEPYIDIFFSDMLFINLKFTYDAHLIRFIKDETHRYEPYYQMLSVEPSLGIGIRF